MTEDSINPSRSEPGINTNMYFSNHSAKDKPHDLINYASSLIKNYCNYVEISLIHCESNHSTFLQAGLSQKTQKEG
ncbi:hypothetical protein JCM16418A_05370 [Paenibacillus pini]